MGVTLPSYLDEALDLIGVSWPNVDEDDYRHMADSMREFATSLEDGTADLHKAIQQMVGANEGAAVEAMEQHWNKVKGKHLKTLADIGRGAADGLDAAALLIEGAKVAAIVQLGILAAEVAAAIAAAPVTLGISTLGGLAGTQVCRIAVKRIFKEVQRAVVAEIMATVTAPLEEALGAMAGDLVVQLGSNALGLQKGVDLGQTADAGKSAMQLNSAGGCGGGGVGTKIRVDMGSYGDLSTAMRRCGTHFQGEGGNKLRQAKAHQGRTRGKDSIANAVNGAMDSAMKGIEQAVKKASKHVGEDMKQGVDQMKKSHLKHDDGVSKDLHKIHKREPSKDDLRKNLGERPVYLLGDRGKIVRLTPNGPRELDADDRKLLGAALKLNSNDNVGKRPKNPKNPYSWGDSTPEERANRPRVDSKKVGWDDELARATTLARHEARHDSASKEKGSYGNYKPGKEDGMPEFSSNNYAAVRVETKPGEDFILVGRSSNPVHSEKVLGIPFLENGTGHMVKDLYTERAPCQGSSDCSAWVKKYFPHVNVTHTVDYGPDEASIARGNKEIEDRLNRMYPGERPKSGNPISIFEAAMDKKNKKST
ncbi:WXG100-like domain-containing protein [Kitasatospora sp. NPDC004240]